MEKSIKLRYSMWTLIFMLIVSFSLISCEKEKESNFPFIEDGILELNTTYQMGDYTGFRVKLSSIPSGNPLVTMVTGTVNLTRSNTSISASEKGVVVNDLYVRFKSADYGPDVERYDAVIWVSGLN